MKDSLARRLLLSALAVALFLVLIEGVLSWGYAFAKTRSRMALRERPEQKHAQHDPELGWTNVPNLVVPDLYGPGKHFSTNAQGFRATAGTPRAVPNGRRRILFAGDSFTMGFGVGDLDTYPAQLERLDARIESVNLGMGAYGVDQAYLRLQRDAANLDRQLVVLAVIGHDFQRMELDYYMAPKPRLALRDGELVPENSPVPERDAGEDARFALTEFFGWLDLGKALSWGVKALAAPRAGASPDATDVDARPFAPIARAIFAALAQQSARAGTPAALLYLPTRDELSRDAAPLRDWAQRAAAASALQFYDATPALRGPDLDASFNADGHYSELGNARVAAYLLPLVQAQLALEPSAPPPQSPP